MRQCINELSTNLCFFFLQICQFVEVCFSFSFFFQLNVSKKWLQTGRLWGKYQFRSIVRRVIEYRAWIGKSAHEEIGEDPKKFAHSKAVGQHGLVLKVIVCRSNQHFSIYSPSFPMTTGPKGSSQTSSTSKRWRCELHSQFVQKY